MTTEIASCPKVDGKRIDRIILDTAIHPSVRQKASQRDFWDSLLDEGSDEAEEDDDLEARLQSLRHIKVAIDKCYCLSQTKAWRQVRIHIDQWSVPKAKFCPGAPRRDRESSSWGTEGRSAMHWPQPCVWRRIIHNNGPLKSWIESVAGQALTHCAFITTKLVQLVESPILWKSVGRENIFSQTPTIISHHLKGIGEEES